MFKNIPVCPKVEIPDLCDGCWFRTTNKICMNLTSILLASCSTKDEGQARKKTLFIEIGDCLIQLMCDRLETTFAFDDRIFVATSTTASNFITMIPLTFDKMVTPLKPSLIGSLLEVLLAIHDHFRNTVEEDGVCERHNTILCWDEVNGHLLQITEPSCEEFRFVNGSG